MPGSEDGRSLQEAQILQKALSETLPAPSNLVDQLQLPPAQLSWPLMTQAAVPAQDLSVPGKQTVL